MLKGRKIALVSLAVILSGISLFADEEFHALITPFIKEHCVQCHGEKKQKGDIRLDTLSTDFTHASNAISWQDVSDMLVIGDMPPEDEPRPPADLLTQVINAIDKELRSAAEQQSGGGRISIRRLSHSALDNTVEDLLGINLQLSEHLPADPELDGFENMAITLEANPEMVLKLQNNAQKIAKLAIVEGEDIRDERRYQIGTIGHGNNVEERDGLVITSSSRDRKHVMWPQGFVAPQDGSYRIQVSALAEDYRTVLEAKGIDYEYVDESYAKNMKTRERRPNGEPRLVSIIAIQASEARHMDAASVPGRRVGYFYTSDQLQTNEVDVRLKEGENIMVHYASAAILNQSPTAVVEGEEMLVADLLRVKEIKVIGPHIESWPPTVHQQLLGQKKAAEKRIEEFLFRAFRRPVPESTVHNFIQLYQVGLNQGLSEEASMRNVVEGVLCSPRFLFNHDKGDGKDAWALASRLSYFLWNSMPDEELLRLAENEQLLNPKVVRKQVIRMLKDTKAKRFVLDFTAQWLGLKNIELMKPDPKLYKDYDPLLEELMRKESELFFEQVLTKNLPLKTFLDSEFVMVNDRLAAHYGIAGVEGNQFRKVNLSQDSPRGGLLGQASILKLTSNGTRTSPVVRGVWVLENLLGAPPSPPPPDVEPIEPDVRGTKTIPEMLAKHREIETCYDCHQKIDPWGLGLEHFDAVGAFRDVYRNLQPIDAKGQVRGSSFDGVEEMKQVLLDRSDQFSQALTEKLFTYALGHPLTFSEKIAADDIAKANSENKDGFKDLIVNICTSPLFRGELGMKDLALGDFN
ncbi:MAG: DUF1592 domain-containing protein [Verrucomicrobia bacterium]|nr:DUF1592 domain-containing protein [Verrucomicrobiota bacterium]MDA1066963.1 DUF1592 domain-containing protein [Verrucomicrobiota bacterium]